MTLSPRYNHLRIPGKALSAALVLGMHGCADVPSDAATWSLQPLEVSFLEAGGMPHLSPTVDGALLSWWAPEEEGHALRAVRWRDGSGFEEPRAIVHGSDFFVNWADFPSVVEVAPGKWVAHWLQRTGSETFAYGIRTAVSEDDGATWSAPWTPHEDGTTTEHGFVTTWPDGDGGWSLVWLDGRRYADGPQGAATDEMSIRVRSIGPGGEPGPEVLVDDRSCDCCQTDAAATDEGTVIVYRDRTADEVRDVYLSRREADGWTEPHPVHDDGWVIGGCPVNGPAMDAWANDVVVAWFTAAQDTPRVQVAFSSDAGDTFGDPIRVDDGNPVGRVDVVRLDDGSAVVAWLEDMGGEGAAVRVRHLTPSGDAGLPWTFARTSAARASGFPQFIRVAGGSDGVAFLAAWTEVHPDGGSSVRMARLEAR